MTLSRVTRLPSPPQLPSTGLWELRLVPCAEDAARAQLTPADEARLAVLPPVPAGRLLARRTIAPALAARALGCRVQELTWSTGSGPRTVRARTGRELSVSLSTSSDRCLLVLSSRPVGVDLEVLSEVPEALAVAELMLSRSERAWVAAADPSRPAGVSDRFLRTWVRKEAVVKCSGTGLTGCDTRAFSVDPAAAAGRVRDAAGSSTGMITWDVPLTGAFAALASTPAEIDADCSSG